MDLSCSILALLATSVIGILVGILASRRFRCLNRPIWSIRDGHDTGDTRFNREPHYTIMGPRGRNISLTDGRTAEAERRYDLPRM